MSIIFVETKWYGVVRAVHAVAIVPDNEVVIGRDVLNELIVTLNGPAYMTQITL